MRTLRLIVEYDGTPFCGWQRQGGDQVDRSVQGALEAALLRLTQAPIRVRGASRTDAGVHARGQVVAFETERDRIPPIGFMRGLGNYLPPQITIRAVDEVEPGWDPRRSARGKRYRYVFWNAQTPSALDRHRSWFVARRLDPERMHEAAQVLLGTHDFSAFRSAGCSALHPIRTLYAMTVRRGEHARIELEVLGNAFLRNMVRILAGNLCEVGQGKKSGEDLLQLLAGRDRTLGAMTAPPEGLCLEEVIYDERLPARPKDNVDLHDPELE